MNARELILLSPYRLPAQQALVLGPEEMAAFMNAYSALWHPAVLWNAAAPPRIDSPYDYEQPKPHHVFAVPEAPPLMMPDDWEERVRAAGAILFKATPDREATLANLKEALRTHLPEDVPPDQQAALAGLPDLEADKVAPFLAVGFGYLMQATLSEAMEHENLLENHVFWPAVQQAIACLTGLPYTPPAEPAVPPQPPYGSEYDNYVPDSPPEDLSDVAAPGSFDGPAPFAENSAPETEVSAIATSAAAVDPDAWISHLRAAAERLLSAREVLYPVAIHLLDLCVLDEHHLDSPWSATFTHGQAVNFLAPSSLLEKLGQAYPERLAALRARIQAEQAEVCGGSYVEREDALLPVESQLWNLLKGRAVSRELLGSEVQVFARKRFAAHPQLPLLLTSAGLTRTLLLTFDDAAVPSYQATVVGWPSPDGKQVEAFTRKPYPADAPETFFNLGHYLSKTIREDHVATLAFVHTGKPAQPWYDDWLALGRLAPVFGQWTTFSRYLNEVAAGEHVSAMSADEFHVDYLSERTNAASPVPVSGFAQQIRLRRRLDTCWTLAALLRGLAGRNDPQRVDEALAALEDKSETAGANPLADAPEFLSQLGELENKVAAALAERLQARAAADQPGFLVLNPCSFTRRVALELGGGTLPVPVGGPVKASQLDGDTLRLVVEVPALGFAWVPKAGPPGAPPPAMRMKLADQRGVRNEFFEAEIDHATGGLRGILDRRTQLNRLGQKLVFNPGSVMQATDLKVTSAGPALGEVVTEGVLLGEQQQVLARFRQRFRAWLGRPVLELRIEIFPELPAAGYPWHAYFGARFAWRDERATLLRGVNGTGTITTHTRPQTPDYLELRVARHSTVIFPGGLPFHQRHETRMLDIILMPEGETATAFDLGIGLDREHPMQTALGMVTPVPLVPTSKGPPHVGTAGWLFHLDAPNLVLTGMRPGSQERPEGGSEPLPAPGDAVTARLLECTAYHSNAAFRCVRDPRRAVLLDARGTRLMDATVSGDAVLFEVAPGDMVQLQMEFG
jgi:hypothetical protein